ncbi:MAG: hypothetical protein ABI822_05630 [Bryobacteraceae bacterium]
MRIAAICVSLLLLASCGDTVVEQYANSLREVLRQYSTQLDARIKADQQMYRDLAQNFSVEAEREVYETLSLERNQQAARMTELLIEGKAVLSDVPEMQRRTNVIEFDRTREYFETELAGVERYTPGIQDLQVDLKKLSALSKALDDLAREPGLQAQLGDLVDFGKAFQSEHELQTCKDVERRSAIAKDSLQDLAAEKKLNPLATNMALDTKITAITAEKASLDAQLLKDSRFKNKKCQ